MEQIKINYTTVSESVYLWIKNAIINGDLKAGERLVQEDLTQNLGVSRTPVRDAFKRLESEGLVINRPRYGAVVFQPSKEQLVEIYKIRTLIEQYCVENTCKLASDKELDNINKINKQMGKIPPAANEYMLLDFRFHKKICELSSCTSVTMEILEGLWNKCSSFKSLYFSLLGKPLDTMKMHGKIVEHLIKRDAARAKIAVAEHYEDVVRSIENSLFLK